MKISRFKIFDYISVAILLMFSIYDQYQEVILSIYTGISVRSIMKILIKVYTISYIPIFLFLLIFKTSYSNRKSIKHTIISTFIYSILLSVIIVDTFIIGITSNSNILWIPYISSLIVILIIRTMLKFIDYKTCRKAKPNEV